jgi:hypothetical protein
LRERQAGLDPALTEIAWRAQKRLHDRYRTLAAKGKDNNQVITAVGRELLGFIWDIASNGRTAGPDHRDGVRSAAASGRQSEWRRNGESSSVL